MTFLLKIAKLKIRKLYTWCTATRLRKILSSTLTVLILLTSIRFLFLKPKEVLADSLIGFNEGYGTTVSDNKGLISGTITNAVWKTEDLCKIGKCLYFDGTGDYVSFGNDSDVDFTTGSFTIQGWFRTPDITSGTRVLVAKYNSATGTDGGYKVYMDASGYLIFGIDNDQTGFPSDSASTSTTAFDDNKWHHFAAVKNGTTSISLYVDGILYQTDSSITASSLTNTDAFYVGIDGDGSSNGYSGFLDEIKVYSTAARSQAEINADKLGETPSRGTSASFGPDNSWISNGLVGYWKLDEASGNATDYSGNNNTLTNYGTTTYTTGKFGNGSEHIPASSQYFAFPTAGGGTYYFDVSDGGPSDPDGNWTDDSNAFDGSTANYAVPLFAGSVSSNYLFGEGTDAPASGESIVSVSARIHGGISGGTPDSCEITAALYTNGLTQNIGSATNTQGYFSPDWGSSSNLTTPTGGWTWDKLQSLEIKNYIFNDGGCGAISAKLTREEIAVTTGTVIDKVNSISFWIDPDSTTNYFLSLNESAYITSSGGTLSATGFTNPKIYVDGIQSSSISANKWQHVVVTSESEIIASQFYIGRQGSNYLDGTMDEVRLYNRVLSPAEVAKLYSWASGPVAYYKFDEGSATSTYDISGYGHDMTITSPDWPIWRTGKFGGGLEFTDDQSPNYGAVTDTTDLSLTKDFTISAWIKPLSNTAATKFGIVSKGPSYNMIQYGDEIRVYIESESVYETTDSTNLQVGTWYFVSANYDASAQTVAIYVNGVEQASTTTGTIPTSISDTTDSVKIGTYVEGSSGNISRSVASSTDDASGEYSDIEANSIITNSNNLFFGKAGSTTNTGSGARFNNIAIPNSATITGATFYATCVDNYSTGGTLQVKLAAENSDDAATFTTSGFNLSSSTRPRTSYTSSWSLASCTTGSEKSKSVTTQVQTVVDRAGWVSGNDLVIIIVNDGSDNDEWQNMYSYDATGQEPRISIDYLSDLNYNYDGFIDEVRIYNYIRTSSQIIEDMNAGHPAPGSPIGSAVARWKFDEGYSTTAYDSNTSTGGAEDLTLSTASWTNNGKFGKAFNGLTNVRASRTDDDDLDFAAGESFTMSLWFKSDSTTNPTANEYLLEKGGNIATPAIGYAIYTSSSGGNVCIGIDDDSTSFPEDSVCTSTDVYDNTWHNLVAVKNANSRLDLYIDGKPNGTADTSISATGTLANAATFYIGDTNATDGTDEFLGDIDEVQIFRSALTASDAMQLYNQGSAQTLGAKSTDSSGNPSWSALDEYCPPGQGSSCTGPYAEYKLDENTGTTAYDTGTSTNNGTLHNTARYTPGKLGSAVYLDGDTTGNDSHIQLPDNAFNSLSEGSISVWYNSNLDNCSGSCDWQEILGQFNTSGGTLWEFAYEISTNRIHIWSDDSDCSSQTGYIAGPSTPGGWHHVVYTVNSSGHKIYLDGVQKTKTGTASNSCFFDDLLGAGAENYAIGCYNYGASPACNSEWWRGYFDNIRIYNYARTPAQIAWEYNRGGPVGWYKFDENTSTSAYDSSGLGSTMTLSSSSWSTGKLNTAWNGDGAKWVSIADASTGDRFDFSATESFAVSTWFKSDSTTNPSANEYLINKSLSGGTQNAGYAIYSKSDSSGSICFGIDDDTTWSPDVETCNSTDLYDQNWHLITAVRNVTDDNIYIYIDGKLASAGTTDSTTATLANDRIMYFGDRNGSDDGNELNGDLDDVRIFRYAPSLQQIQLIMNEGGATRFGPVTGTP